MPYNCSAVNSPFSDRQIWQLSYEGAFALIDSSCMPIEQLAISETVSSHIGVCPLDSILLKLNRQIIHVTINVRAENADVCTGNHVVQQR
jgi:hypothetical protein